MGLSLKRLLSFMSVLIMASLLFTASDVFAKQALADEGDLLVGVFYRSADDWTNNIYVSKDGEMMQRVASTFETTGYDSWGTPVFYDGNGGVHYAQKDASIVFYNGYFWSISGWNRNDGKIWVTISYSSDLVNWTYPEGDALLSPGSTKGIPVDSLPTVNGADYGDFDLVAPEWFVNKDGQLYIIVSCGYYGAFHGDATNDQMQAYIVKVDNLSANGYGSKSGDYYWPRSLTFQTGIAHKLGFSNYSGANYIDGAGYAENGVDYLVIKKDGMTNQLFQTSNIADANSWSLVNESMTYGYEGASIGKIGGMYYMYADHINGVAADGVGVVSSNSLTKSEFWGTPHAGCFIAQDGSELSARHGTVITMKQGAEGWDVAKKLLDETPSVERTMFRLYNPNSGEHFYTASVYERNAVIDAGWNDEGVGWIAPSRSDSPVYRLYNANGGEHHYTLDASERDHLVSVGWNYEGIGWCSDDAKTVPLFREYNPNAFANNHNYTTDENEHAYLVSLGWRDEGIGWYALSAQ